MVDPVRLSWEVVRRTVFVGVGRDECSGHELRVDGVTVDERLLNGSVQTRPVSIVVCTGNNHSKSVSQSVNQNICKAQLLQRKQSRARLIMSHRPNKIVLCTASNVWTSSLVYSVYTHGRQIDGFRQANISHLIKRIIIIIYLQTVWTTDTSVVEQTRCQTTAE